MSTLQCRLCSSSNSLLTLFSGKRKLFRDYIQILTSFVIGIEFKKNDLRKYICYTCIVQVYNCYVFKICSLQNDKKFEAILYKNNSDVEGAVQEDTHNLELPKLNELRNHFLPWLLSKQNLSTDTEQNEDKVKHTWTQTDLSSLNMVNTYSQCDIQVAHHKKKMKDKDIQTLSDNNLEKFNMACQTDSPTPIVKPLKSTAATFSQTDCVQHKTIAVQTISRGRKRKNGLYSGDIGQKDVDNVNILKRKCMVEITRSVKNGFNEYSVVGQVLEQGDAPKVVFVEDIKKLSNAVDEKFLSVNEVKPKFKWEGSQSFKQEILKSDYVCCKMEEDTAKKLLLKAEVETNLDKNETVPISKTHSMENQSHQYLSPRSSGLLSVKDKVEYVRVCSYCDDTLYSKNEMRSHWRKHLKCRFCQRKFTRIRNVQVHMASECEKRLIPQVELIRLEKCRDFEANYSQIREQLTYKRKKSDSSGYCK